MCLRWGCRGPRADAARHQRWDRNTKRIRLKGDPARVFVLIIGDGIDHETDFLLHYFVTTWTPPEGFDARVVPHPDMRQVAEEDGLHHLS